MKELYQSRKAISPGKGSSLLEIVVGSFGIYGHEFKESDGFIAFYGNIENRGCVYRWLG